jgi:hypothetical protein
VVLGSIAAGVVAFGCARPSSHPDAAPRAGVRGVRSTCEPGELPPGDWQCARDPTGTIAKAEMQSYELCFHGHDRKASIIVGWDAPVAERLMVAVRASDGLALGPDNPAVTASSAVGYKILGVDLDALRAQDPAKLGATAWRIEIVANQFADGDHERFFYSIVLSSDLRLVFSPDGAQVPVGGGVTLTAGVLDAGLTDTLVELTSPDPTARPSYLALHDDGLGPDALRADGIYSVRVGPLQTPGYYLAKIRLSGFASQCFQRETTVMVLVTSGA